MKERGRFTFRKKRLNRMILLRKIKSNNLSGSEFIKVLVIF